ncbi:hypothetical protein ONE63_005484 [Megalurothrips usitatus]|uniref:Uncharacterized protein n=1 Tax=Megalurothrips usitatus TaxID=439358 RepID=A0AAV7XZH7_9NEOP|nr:hypothetical protein ONE63_005484 [Megalurothrips usitatus]
MQAAVLEVACVIGLQDVQGVSRSLNDLMADKDVLFLTSFLNGVRKNPEPYCTGALVVLLVYSFSCVLLIYGALKLNVWMVFPFVVLEFLRLCASLAALVAGMLVLKKNSMDLGQLMGGCTGGGFCMLFMLYMWACPLSLAQELHRRGREARARGNVSGFHNGFGNGYASHAMEAKMWQQQTAHRPRYPYVSHYPGGYPAYID